MSMLLTGVGNNGFVPVVGSVYYRQGQSNASPYANGWINCDALVFVGGSVAEPFTLYIEGATATAGLTLMLYSGDNLTGVYDVQTQVGWNTALSTGAVEVWNGSAWDATNITNLATPPTFVGYGEGVLAGDNLLGTAGGELGFIKVNVASVSGEPLRIASILVNV